MLCNMPCQACEVLGCRIDYLATHDYANYPTNQADRLLENLEMLYNRSRFPVA